MSLRVRLTVFYTSLMGGILLLFGVAVFTTVRFTIISQVDDNLRKTATNIIEGARVDTEGKLTLITAPMLGLPTDVYFQVWGNDKSTLQAASPNINQSDQALDPAGLQAPRPVFHDVTSGKIRLRVLTIPLELRGQPAGIIQVAAKLAIVDTTQNTLGIVLVINTLLALVITGLLVWSGARRTMMPLEASTDAALQITQADDLSRRIPYQGPSGDEAGQLIQAFNQTLERLEKLFHTQRRFMADVGHELRTPLTVIKGNVGLMRRMGFKDDESLISIESEVDRLTRLVGDLLLLAQVEAGKLPMERKLVELDTVVLEALNQMRVLARDKLNLHLGDMDQVLVCGDADRLKQVLVNLIGNAIQYTPAGGEVIVGLGKTEDQARLTIRDNGPGIPAEDLPHIFERFYRGEKSRTRSADGKGFGLGLSIAYWIVRNHGGQIDVHSTEGRGTTFSIRIPLAKENCTEAT